MSVIVTIISYVADFFVGFFSNKVWDWWKTRRDNKDTRFSFTKKQDNTVTIDAHIVTQDKDTMDSAVALYSSISGADKKVNH